MTAEIPKPAEIRRTKGYLMRRVLAKWPFLVWLGVAILTYGLYHKGVQFERMNGVVVAETEILAALEDGVIAKISVNEKGDTVTANQTVVEIDDRRAVGELEQLQQELKLKELEESRKFSTLTTELESDIIKVTSDKQGAEKRLEYLEAFIPKLEDRVKRGVASPSELEEAKLEQYTLSEVSIPAFTERLKGLDAEKVKAQALIRQWEELKKEKSVEARLLEERIERMKLISTLGGKVSNIYFKKGSVVKRSEPIVEIVSDKIRGARGFILEADADKVFVGMTVYISSVGGDQLKYYEGKISYIAPGITSTSEVGGTIAGRVIKGREIICTFDSADVSFLPDQSVSIHLQKPGKFKPFSFGSPKAGE